MRPAVLATEEPVRRVTHAIARGVRDTGFRNIDAQAQHGADAAAMLPVARRVRTELVVLERQGEARFGDWKIIDSSVPPEKLSSTEQRFRLAVPANGTATLTYTVQFES